MNTLREAAQQALEALETGGWNMTTRAIADLEAALAQQAEPQGCATEEDCTKQPWCRIRGECQRKQAEPDHETRAELAEQQVVQLAEERDHFRNLWQKAQQDEPHATAAELRRLRHNNQVLTDALWKACGDDEEAVNSTIASQGELK